MTHDEYVLILWRVIATEAAIIAALVAVVWRHIRMDIERARDLERCKRVLGIKDE